MRLKFLIKKLKEKAKLENPQVQFLICREDGRIIAMRLQKKNIDMQKIADLFSKEPPNQSSITKD